jgi:hypothetical protein
MAINVIKAQLVGYSGNAKLSVDYILHKQQLQDLEILQATSTGIYRMLTPATVPRCLTLQSR